MHINCLFICCSLYDAYSDEMGTIDFSRSQNGSGMASQSQVYVTLVSSTDLPAQGSGDMQ